MIRMQQPYSSFAKTLLERQNYPDLAPVSGRSAQAPYDVTAHTLPLLMGVAVDTVEQPFEVALAGLNVSRRLASGLSAASGFGHAIPGGGQRACGHRARVSGAMRRPGISLLNQPRRQTLRAVAAAAHRLVQELRPQHGRGLDAWLLEQFGFKYASVVQRRPAGGRSQAKVRRHRLSGSARRSDSQRPQCRAPCPRNTPAVSVQRGAEALKQFARDGRHARFS